ncbi:AAA family ATPase [Thalassobius sp. Cn5-15]|uniref:AAA family ATPase n=1 Tax=Thalassobius sp. Cn5-15 TaxID=2917763 RepID=UPI001EF1F0C0|nr:AAA family ATPase [Thalassobius sp. Cn5-15]MCG7495202.1 AAA family ATPase [Thalassobius sp. Cn5-15]
MQLSSFRIQNFRSIADSGEIMASRITALLGRNESGKTNLLRALASLKPPEGISELSKIKDFPRNRRLSECTPDTPVVETSWELTEQEWNLLQGIWPRAKAGEPVRVGRNYAKGRWVSIPANPIEFDQKHISSVVKKTSLAAKAVADKLEEGAKLSLVAAADAFAEQSAPGDCAKTWASALKSATEALGIALAAADAELSEKQDDALSSLADLAEQILNDETAHQSARNWVGQHLPTFVYLADYPEIEGHQDISAFLQRKQQDQQTDADINFEKMCRVADLDPERLQELVNSNTEERNQLANRASAVISGELQSLWTDRKLKVRFNPDGNHLETMVSEVTDNYDVEVNLDERSRGFQWFFGFYMIFSADTQGGEKDGAILLLDEPGLYLHAKSQGDLLRHLENDFKNQILYTTHSPFMVPTHHLDWVRTVNISVDKGTSVTNDPTGDARTLFPLQAALGYDLAQSLFLGGANLVVEGVTDYWLLSAASEYLSEIGGVGLDSRLTLTPAGGAQKIPYMVSLLVSENLDVIVLLDHEKDAAATKNGLIKGKLLRDQNVVSIADAFLEESRPNEADVEDLLDAAVYEALVRESYEKELQGKTLKINERIPRLAKRMEQAFQEVGLEFNKTRPMRLFLRKMGTDPGAVMTDGAKDRIGRLFTATNERFERHVARDGQPFD